MNDYKKNPLFKKARHIHKLIDALVGVMDDDNEFLKMRGSIMLEDVMVMNAKIVGALGVDLYSLKMQNAALIRYHAMNLYVTVGALRYEENYNESEFVEPIRKEIDEFRLMFIDWVHGFDKSNYIWDEWELFNPPNAIPPSENDYNDPINWDDF